MANKNIPAIIFFAIQSSGEIGDIMNISAHTVNFHIKKSLLKLDAANKTAAVVKAAMMGLL